jgi:hypothetical protein
MACGDYYPVIAAWRGKIKGVFDIAPCLSQFAKDTLLLPASKHEPPSWTCWNRGKESDSRAQLADWFA